MHGRNSHVDRTWNKPELIRRLKLNIDTAVFQDGNINVDCVFCDTQRRFVDARCKKCQNEAKAINLKEVLSWVIEQH